VRGQGETPSPFFALLSATTRQGASPLANPSDPGLRRVNRLVRSQNCQYVCL
jgi:hypothetical protein